MLELLTFVGVAALTVDLLVRRGSDLVAWLKGAEATVVAEAKSVEQTVSDTVKKL